jgi:cbb3-type cytochrome oxidase maturation protein
MTMLIYLIPVALLRGALGLGAFLWSLRSGQYEDLDGAAERILLDDESEDAARRMSGPPGRRRPSGLMLPQGSLASPSTAPS